MAELAKKLNFLKDGVHQTAKAYSTTIETGGEYITNIIDGVTCYIPVGNESDGRATKARILKSGATKAIFNTGKPVYTEKSWTTAGTYTWTVPAGVTRIRVACCGGGAGGVGYYHFNYSKIQTSGSGGTSSFGDLILATGGQGGEVDSRRNPSTKTTIYGSSPSIGGTPNGITGDINRGSGGSGTIANGAHGFKLGFTMNNGDYGAGGRGRKNSDTGAHIVGGGSGGYDSKYIDVIANTVYVIKVGEGGAGGNPNAGDTAGTSGFVLIAYGGDI